jgi:quercetin dioxygenase-like cupin family protein
MFITPNFRTNTKEEQMADVNDLVGTVLNMKDMVSYQPGAVVSRTVIDKDAGTVTLFAFDNGQGLSEHTAPFDALVQIIDGTADITIAGSLHAIKEGEMIIMPANIPHALKANPRFKMLLVMIRK